MDAQFQQKLIRKWSLYPSKIKSSLLQRTILYFILCSVLILGMALIIREYIQINYFTIPRNLFDNLGDTSICLLILTLMTILELMTALRCLYFLWVLIELSCPIDKDKVLQSLIKACNQLERLNVIMMNKTTYYELDDFKLVLKENNHANYIIYMQFTKYIHPENREKYSIFN